MRSLMRTAAGLVLVVLAAACGSDGDPAGDPAGSNGSESPTASEAAAPAELTTVRFTVSATVIGPQTATYSSLPITLGFAEEEGVDVEIVQTNGSSVAISAIVGGQADMGMVGGAAAIQAIASGEDLVVPYLPMQRDTNETAVLADSDIRTYADLEGKTVGLSDLTSAIGPWTKAGAQEAGIDPESITFIAVGQGAQAAVALEQGQIDAISDTDGAMAALENAGVELRRIENPIAERNALSAVIIVSRAFMEEHPDAVVGATRAIARSTIWAAEHPEEAVRLHYEAHPDTKPDAPDDEAIAQGARQLAARNSKMVVSDGGTYGVIEEDRLEFSINFLFTSGAIERQVEPSEFYDDSLIEEINDFDREATIAHEPS